MHRGTLQEITLSLAGGTQQKVTIPGNYIKFVSGTGPLFVETPEGSKINLVTGRSIRIAEFEHFLITSNSIVDDNKTIIVGYGEINENVTQGSVGISGSVSVSNTDYESLTSTDFQNYILKVDSGGSTGKYPSAMIFNRPDSNFNIIVKTVKCTWNIAAAIMVRRLIPMNEADFDSSASTVGQIHNCDLDDYVMSGSASAIGLNLPPFFKTVYADNAIGTQIQPKTGTWSNYQIPYDLLPCPILIRPGRGLNFHSDSDGSPLRLSIHVQIVAI